jgi:hypothetical protein
MAVEPRHFFVIRAAARWFRPLARISMLMMNI